MAKPPIIITNTLLFSLSGLVALVAVPWYGMSHGYDIWQWVTLLLLFCLSGLSITAGYHRLWSHKTYKAHPALQWLFAFGGALALRTRRYTGLPTTVAITAMWMTTIRIPTAPGAVFGTPILVGCYESIREMCMAITAMYGICRITP